MFSIKINLQVLLMLFCVPMAWGSDSWQEPSCNSITRGMSFNAEWKFQLGDTIDEANWRTLNLPHDWAIEGDFSSDNPSGTGGGALPGGVGWYQKTFSVDENLKNKRLFLDFDGAYMNASVYVNGKLLGTRPYGYSSFSYDITDCLTENGKNVVTVKVDNAEQPNSRWYSGCGIYRNVWLRVVNDTHIAKDGVFITTDGNALSVETAVNGKVKNIVLKHSVIASDGKLMASASAKLKGNNDRMILTIDSPELWNVESPNLYTVVSSLVNSKTGEVVDVHTTKTGFRSFKFDPVTGFSLNGKPMKINGVCLHHDAGALGAVVNTAAIRRQLSLLKDMGCNAIRCTHNPPAPELLDLCDSMGFLVMDESFDMWRKRKSAHDYARYFDEWHERDLDDLVRRDRNHPSVIIWSIGNEVLEQWSNAKADTLSLAEANLILNLGHSKDQSAQEGGEISVNSLLTRKLADRVRSLDPTRPITAGCNEPNPGNHLFRSGALDIIGYNYHNQCVAGVPENFPGKPFILTESNSAIMTRGYYQMPADSISIWPERWDKPFFNSDYSCSSYDNCHVPWGNTHEASLKIVRDNDFVAGQFVWTGFDYLGEPTPFGWPARSSYFGIIDLAGFPKDVYYLYQSEWQSDRTVLHLLPHWNWEQGQMVDVWAYYNNADEVELYVNGVSQGVSCKTPDRFHAAWKVEFVPGTLMAVSRRDGREVAREEIMTAGIPHHIRLTADRDGISADGKDLCYLTAEIVDVNGNVCPWATDNITFKVEGPAFNAGVDNGSPISHESFKSDHRKAFYGKALLIVQSNGSEGDILVTASAPGLQSATVNLKSE